MLHRSPRRFQQQPVLWIDQHRLALRQPEERRVETCYVIDEACPAADDLPGRIGIRVVVLVDVPTIRGHLRYGIAAVSQHLPELVRIGSTRNAQCVTDYRETLPDPLCFTSPHGCLDCQGVVLSAIGVFDRRSRPGPERPETARRGVAIGKCTGRPTRTGHARSASPYPSATADHRRCCYSSLPETTELPVASNGQMLTRSPKRLVDMSRTSSKPY